MKQLWVPARQRRDVLEMADSPSTLEPAVSGAATSLTRGAAEGGPPLEYFTVGSRSGRASVRELWRHRELLWILALRDLKVRYRQTLIGVAWAVLQPACTLTIFLVLFGLLGREPGPDGTPYALVVICGLLPWQLFATIVTQSSGSLVAQQSLIGKVYFPRLILPLATAVPALVDFAVAFVLLVVMLVGYRVAPSWGVMLLPGAVLMAVLAALAAGVWLAALNALYRDVGFVVPFLLQVGFFASPVVYATDGLIPERWQLLFSVNPLVGVIEGFRWSLLGRGPAPVGPLLLAVIVVTVVLVSGLAYFHRTERCIADRI
jgi:lipopolysaccharide transport system permease protein